MTYATMWTYPWDLLDDGVETVLRYLKDEVGLDAVSVATSYHSVEHLRPHTRGGRRYFIADGAVYFRPDPELWQGAPLQPIVSPLAQRQDPLALIGEAAEKIGIKLVSWTVCLHNSNLGRRYPHAVQRNAFGDPYPPYLCPSNPDVQDYVERLTKNLASRYPLFAVELESLSFGSFPHFHGHEKVGFELSSVGRAFLSFCFCEHCRREAEEEGVEVAALQQWVQDVLLQIFERGGPLEGAPHISELLREDLQRFDAIRRETVAALHRRVKRAVGERAYVIGMEMGSPLTTGFDGSAIAPIVDAYEVLAYTTQAEVVEQRVQAALRFCEPDDLIVGLSALSEHAPSPKVLAANVRRALSLGVRGFSFYNYGIMPRRHLQWVAEAVRQIRKADTGS
ncbi:MAG: hypothetical protein KatS3mg115_1696 [Candidatus Poribacteria bacterium]|nr:MAG: hypothetical protein KatS3mg115_1696 [Candidatus Poribacteria bacterium]